MPEAVEALKAGKIDALVQDDTIPNGVIWNLAATPGMTIKLLSHADAISKMQERYGPIYYQGTIPRGAYPGVGDAAAVAVTAHLLVCLEDFPRDRAYELAKTLSERMDEWKSPQKGVDQLSLTSTPFGSSLPFHPGALDYLSRANR